MRKPEPPVSVKPYSKGHWDIYGKTKKYLRRTGYCKPKSGQKSVWNKMLFQISKLV